MRNIAKDKKAIEHAETVSEKENKTVPETEQTDKTNEVTDETKQAEKAGEAADETKPAEKASETVDEVKPDGKKGSGKKKLCLGVTAVVLVIGVLLTVYFYGAYYYERHFFPNTEINGLDCSKLTAQEAVTQLQQLYTEQYSLQVQDRNGRELLMVAASDAEMKFFLEQSVEQALEGQNGYRWPGFVFTEDKEQKQAAFGVEYNQDVLRDVLTQAGLFDASEGEEPQNAYISEYLPEQKAYAMIPEKEGTILDEELTLEKVGEALLSMETVLNLEDAKCYEQPEITSDNRQLQERLDKLNKIVGTCVTYDWNGNEEVLDGELIHDWLVFDGDEISLDEELVAVYVAEKAKKYDSYGKKRSFVTTLGVELVLPGGAFGWKTDREAETSALMELILEGAVTEREPIYSSQGRVKGINDIGKSYVEIDLTNQHLYLYKDGELVLETDFVSGNMANGNITPPGIFGLTYKTTNAVLRGQDYETPVSYWMPFNGNVGMHDATWRKNFGGDIYLTNGSHGCVNLPLDMAASIYGYVSTGFPVICYYY